MYFLMFLLFIFVPLIMFADIFGAENALTAYLVFLAICILIGIVVGVIRTRKNSSNKGDMDVPNFHANYPEPKKMNSANKTKSTSAANPVEHRQKPALSKKISLYEALRLPGDPDPEFGGCSIYVDVNDTCIAEPKGKTIVWNYDDDFIDVEEDFEETEDEFEELDDEELAFGTLVLHELLSDRHEDEDKNDGYDDDYSWETHCEYCGELLEDCVCDYKHESHEAISLRTCGCEEEEDDDWGSSKRDDDDQDRLCDFDEFRSF